ncbi:MAG: AI-2E family transporter [Oscillospiraceae bacterium]|nr:AI-2E family transporter [Oscillospiraceae bacterium]
MQLNSRTEKQLSRIIQIVYVLMMLLAFYFFMRYGFWLVFPFLFSFFVAMLLQKPMDYAHQKFRLKKSFTAISLVLLFYLIVLLLIGLLGVRLVAGAKSFMDYLMAQLENVPQLADGMRERISGMLGWLPDDLELRLNERMLSFTQGLGQTSGHSGNSADMLRNLFTHFNFEWLKTPMSGVLNTASKIPAILVAAAITVVSSFFMTLGYGSIASFIMRQLSPGHQEALTSAKRIILESLKKIGRSYVIIIIVTFVELMLGLGLLQLLGLYSGKYLMSIALFTALADILPVLGTGLVLAPWALYHLIMGNYGFAVGLIVVLAIIAVVRQVLEPKLLATNLGLPPVMTVIGLYVGLQLFGFIGMLLMPLLLTLLKVLNDEGVIRFWKPLPPEEPKPQKQAGPPKRPKAPGRKKPAGQKGK